MAGAPDVGDNQSLLGNQMGSLFDRIGSVQPDGKPVAEDAQTTGSSERVPATDIALTDLLDKPSGYAAAWFLDQVKELEGVSDVESTDVFKVASALKNASIESKEALIGKMMQGIKELPTEQRAEFLLLVTKLPNLGNAAELKGAASSTEASGTFARVAQEAGAAEMPPEEKEKLAMVVQNEQGTVVPAMIEVVPELSEDQRKRLTNSLVEKGVVKEDHRVLLEETLKPGGHVDHFQSIWLWIHRAYTHTWATLVVPILEVVLIIVLAIRGCTTPLFAWLIVDAVVAFCIAAVVHAAKYCLDYPYKEFCENPLQMSTRIKEQLGQGVNFTDTVPGSFNGLCLLMQIMSLVTISAILAVAMGFTNLLATLSSPCDGLSTALVVVGSLPILWLRLVSLSAVGWFACKSYSTVTNFKGTYDSSKSKALIPVAEIPVTAKEGEGYGSV
jgi:hypothetical protein